MSRFKLTLENTSESLMEEGDNIQNLEDISNRIDVNGAQVEEAEDINEGLDKVENLLESSIVTDEINGTEGPGITPETAQAIEIATEHFARRLNTNYRVLPSLESFSNNGSRDATLVALKRVNRLQDAVNDSLVIANEGVVDDIKTAFKMSYETTEKVQARLKIVSKKEFKENENFDNDTWAKYLPTPMVTLSATEIIKIAEEAVAANKSSKVSELVKKFIDGIKKATLEVRGIWFWSNSTDIARINDISEKINSVADELKQVNETASAGKHREAREFTTPNEQEAKRLVKAIEELLSESSIDILVKQLQDKSFSMKLWSLWNHGFRFKTGLIGSIPVVGAVATVIGQAQTLGDEPNNLDIINAEDLKATKEAVVKARRALSSLRLISIERVKLASALTSYLENSTK